MNPRIAGILLFIAAALIAIGYALWPQDESGSDPIAALISRGRPAEVVARGFVGGEKRNFLANPEVEDRLESEYGIRLDIRRAGSLEMVSDPNITSQNPDFYWPSSQVAEELGRQSGLTPVQTEIIFNSPIVLFSWAPIAEALEQHGIARPLTAEKASYAVDTRALLELVTGHVMWRDLGLDQLYGSVMVFSTDPLRSNSGNQFASLMVRVLSDGQTEGPDFDAAVASVVEIYQRMGYTEHSSSDLFEQYLRTGMGAKPIVAGYENQLIEFAAAEGERWDRISASSIRPVILYPEPTVYSSHIVLATSDAGRAVIAALGDTTLQEIAWRQHGFRSGFTLANNPADLPVSGIPETLGMIVPMLPYAAVERLMESLGGGVGGGGEGVTVEESGDAPK